jgi:hypothetical protein
MSHNAANNTNWANSVEAALSLPYMIDIELFALFSGFSTPFSNKFKEVQDVAAKAIDGSSQSNSWRTCNC